MSSVPDPARRTSMVVVPASVSSVKRTRGPPPLNAAVPMKTKASSVPRPVSASICDRSIMSFAT